MPSSVEVAPMVESDTVSVSLRSVCLTLYPLARAREQHHLTKTTRPLHATCHQAESSPAESALFATGCLCENVAAASASCSIVMEPRAGGGLVGGAPSPAFAGQGGSGNANLPCVKPHARDLRFRLLHLRPPCLSQRRDGGRARHVVPHGARRRSHVEASASGRATLRWFAGEERSSSSEGTDTNVQDLFSYP